MNAGLETLNAIADVILAHRPTGKKRKPPRSLFEAAAFGFYEFFAGGGMARAGLDGGWKCLFANDFDFKKCVTYTDNWGADGLKAEDVGKLKPSDLPGRADLAWASFPCQDLSLAGMGAGLKGDRSGTFWPFWELMRKLKQAGRGPKIVVLENVCGTLTSHDGKDFAAIADALNADGYQFGAIILNAREFVPQSRPRLFIVAVADGVAIPASVKDTGPNARHTMALQRAQRRLSEATRKNWVWWKVPAAPKRKTKFADLLEKYPASVQWNTVDETAELLAMMTPRNLKKVTDAKKLKRLCVGTIYKRTRTLGGVKKVRAEVRFDDIAGCLRTSSGGSSRQTILVVDGDTVRSRLVSSREAARLMGLPDDYKLPENYNEAYHLTGDGVVVPVVRHLAANILEPILGAQSI